MKLSLNICHLYSDLMDTYGDKGNITALTKRCQWRDIDISVTSISVGDKLSALTLDFDLYFFGGGQDRQQILVGQDLQKKSKEIKEAIESGAVMLSICGGYQLLQNYFKTLEGVEIKGIGLFDAHTKGSTTRMIGNLLINLNHQLKSGIDYIYPASHIPHPTSNLIGFENHSGKTYLGKDLKPLGTVIKGFGNNGEDKTEGAIYKNAFGCYLHGSLLPKNPHFADYLIVKALERRHGMVKLKPLDDAIEWQAHESAIKRIP
ncbi:glutamine amidotransferase [Candidatus Curtissbacteria bacterium RIFCSPHIGHO2_01_FULL_41_11]|uniref:Lipid II isoglutaminyl synthase (glutamine-hydrolyzing) subunit GatD n=1 Tax=Candidatus Curtissbacteria bacterium RIFCSPHIGHO2_01_FULL_41_11 TaxID=1797711 RepID=A0A1F5G390_9BACT|nr:MAG: glutamine amidotransferase [Candidatus Curtissbacteria bacterium RIFCSPHIGHO2_01_FULL_41_11]